jgi:hypothetical protein
MDEEYVQEHTLTGGVIAPVGGASPTHSLPLTNISLGIVSTDESSTRLQYRQAAALHRSPRLHLFTDHRVVITAERRLGELFAQSGSRHAVADDDERFGSLIVMLNPAPASTAAPRQRACNPLPSRHSRD